MAVIDKKIIDSFYAIKRIAVIGTSRKKRKYGRMVFEELIKKDFDAIPVNPSTDLIGKHKCYKNIKDVSPAPQAVIAVVPPGELEQIVADCAQTGVKTIWMHEHVMKGVSNPKAIHLCEEKGLTCITGFCPMMFMPNAGFPHNLHASIMKMFGAYPK